MSTGFYPIVESSTITVKRRKKNHGLTYANISEKDKNGWLIGRQVVRWVHRMVG